MEVGSSATLTGARKYRARSLAQPWPHEPLRQSLRVVALRAWEAGQRRVRVPAVPGVEQAIRDVRGEFPGVELLADDASLPGDTAERADASKGSALILAELYERSQGDPAELLDFLYDTLDDMLLTERFDACDAVLRGADVARLSVEGMIGLLTISLAAKHLLPSRPRLVQRVEVALRAVRAPAEVEALLAGLAR